MRRWFRTGRICCHELETTGLPHVSDFCNELNVPNGEQLLSELGISWYKCQSNRAPRDCGAPQTTAVFDVSDCTAWTSRSSRLSLSIRSLPRLILAVFGLIFATALMAPPIIVAGLLTSGGRPAFAGVRIWAWMVAKSMGLTFSCQGAEKVAPETSYIVTPNHQSNSDILALLRVMPLKFRWVVKRELLKIPLFGWALAGSGAIALNRADRAQSISRLQQAESKLQGGWSVLIYPEGTRSPDGNIHAFKKGAFMMAVQTGIPILPVTCNGAFKILPRDTVALRPGHITVTIGDPIDTTGLTIEDVPQLMEKTRQEMSKHLDPYYDPFRKTGSGPC